MSDYKPSDYKPLAINAATQANNSIMDMKNKVISNDVILNNILKYSKQKTFITGNCNLTELKSMLLPHYGIGTITDHHLLNVVLSKYNIILNNKIYEVNKSIDSIISDLLKPGVFVSVNEDTIPYITTFNLINVILMEIALSRVDWLDYSKT
jgi:hypothetical protein